MIKKLDSIGVKYMNKYYQRKKCRICNSSNLISYFDFRNMPLANELKLSSTDFQNKFPLEVMLCKDCFLSQLSIVVDPKFLFANYAYHSSISRTFSDHCYAMGMKVFELFGRKVKCLDIASNDGCLLQEFKKCGHDVLGVEPAENLCHLALTKGIPSINDFWGTAKTTSLVLKQGKREVITATNVFAHVDDVNAFVREVYNTLDNNGIFIIEFPYMGHLIENTEFDTIYHEHLSYFLLAPIKKLLEINNMKLLDVEEFDIHGGTLRVYAVKSDNILFQPNEKNIDSFLNLERKRGYLTEEPYFDMDKKAKKIKDEFMQFLTYEFEKGKTFAGYGASAKGNVFVNSCNASSYLKYIIDDTPAKQGKYYSGTKLPIVSREYANQNPTDYMVLLAWNFAEELIKNTANFKNRGGKYIVSIPKLRII